MSLDKADQVSGSVRLKPGADASRAVHTWRVFGGELEPRGCWQCLAAQGQGQGEAAEAGEAGRPRRASSRAAAHSSADRAPARGLAAAAGSGSQGSWSAGASAAAGGTGAAEEGRGGRGTSARSKRRQRAGENHKAVFSEESERCGRFRAGRRPVQRRGARERGHKAVTKGRRSGRR